MTDLLPVGLVEMLAELERDLLARRRLYHNRTYTRRLSVDRAERRLEILEALIVNIRAQLTPEDLVGMEAANEKKKELKIQRIMRRIASEPTRRR